MRALIVSLLFSLGVNVNKIIDDELEEYFDDELEEYSDEDFE